MMTRQQIEARILNVENQLEDINALITTYKNSVIEIKLRIDAIARTANECLRENVNANQQNPNPCQSFLERLDEEKRRLEEYAEQLEIMAQRKRDILNLLYNLRSLRDTV